ncbi:hypothetical protein [Streptomyces litchfieldiae]|uniref:Uncharacterized protein n=1 Tax=Streptomyces litchfieldiae TaxID=3075543 RepID=A0ABU2MS42_9ACTN|nr:hypothetical protein [Streptomyces sp. DSM 44938]MDT0344451.1 hypothetical protein [Streptomyces sp. DSM 44938]
MRQWRVLGTLVRRALRHPSADVREVGRDYLAVYEDVASLLSSRE